jgi:superfamily I DNA/RNA helicase
MSPKRVHLGELLALMFTAKAAVETAERVDQRITYRYAAPLIGTLHAFGDRILRE